MIFYRDSIEIEIKSKKVYKTRDGHVVEEYVKSEDNQKGYFVTLAGLPYCAHGSSIEKAISDAVWKDPKQRPSLEALKKEIVEAGPQRKISLNEFKTLTGACNEGCEIALKRAKLDGSPMLPKDILKQFPEWGRRLYEVLGFEYDRS